jgi:opacity protein-like surface antigen
MRLALAVLLLAAPAFAAVPEKGEGTITLFGGMRSFLGNQGYVTEQLAQHNELQPGGLASFGYQYDEDLHFRIDVGYMMDKYRIAGGDLDVRSIPILLALDTAVARGQRYSLYLGGGIGYSLNSGTRNGATNEANSTAVFAALGFRYQLAGPVALVLEDRYTLANAQVDAANSNQSFNVGGNLLSLGVMFHFLQPDDKGHPQSP